MGIHPYGRARGRAGDHKGRPYALGPPGVPVGGDALIVLPQGPGLVRKAQEIVGADVVVLTQKGKLGKGRCLAAIFHFTNLILFDTEKIGQVFLSFSPIFS